MSAPRHLPWEPGRSDTLGDDDERDYRVNVTCVTPLGEDVASTS
jgi:hypothetical protein